MWSGVSPHWDPTGERERRLLRSGWSWGAVPPDSPCRWNPLILLRRSICWAFTEAEIRTQQFAKPIGGFRRVTYKKSLITESEMNCVPFLSQLANLTQAYSDCPKCVVASLFCCGAYTVTSFQRANIWGLGGTRRKEHLQNQMTCLLFDSKD